MPVYHLHFDNVGPILIIPDIDVKADRPGIQRRVNLLLDRDPLNASNLQLREDSLKQLPADLIIFHHHRKHSVISDCQFLPLLFQFL